MVTGSVEDMIKIHSETKKTGMLSKFNVMQFSEE